MMMLGFGSFFLLLILLAVVWFLVRGLRFVARRNQRPSRPRHDGAAPRDIPRDRRQARLESEIFRLAAQRQGRLTLSEVVIETGMGLREAEELMDRLAKGTHVRLVARD